jgi:hypothetical protein
MIGKIFRQFSNDWKKFSESHKEHKEHKRIKGGGRDAGGERKGIHKNGEKTASRTRTRSVEELKGWKGEGLKGGRVVYLNVSDAASRTRMTGRAGGMPTLKTMKTASRTLKGGRDAGGTRKESAHAEARRLGGGRFCTKGQKGNKRGGWSAGGMSALKSMKTAARTLKGGREADGMPGFWG